ncbi:MAG: cob(I)yrinic acid a,c-diamide adenosyltransferase [Castellaniella sp.]
MGTRLSIITTRTGDEGTTGLGDGRRVSKSSTRVATLGEIDELNSMIGLLRTEDLPVAIDTLLKRIQHDLFDMGSEICIPGHEALTEAHVQALEQALEHHNAALGKLAEFILPGGTRAAALAHVARTICRRAERQAVRLDEDEADAMGVNPPVRLYLNRLSDLLFVIARAINRAADRPDVLWER